MKNLYQDLLGRKCRVSGEDPASDRDPSDILEIVWICAHEGDIWTGVVSEDGRMSEEKALTLILLPEET